MTFEKFSFQGFGQTTELLTTTVSISGRNMTISENTITYLWYMLPLMCLWSAQIAFCAESNLYRGIHVEIHFALSISMDGALGHQSKSEEIKQNWCQNSISQLHNLTLSNIHILFIYLRKQRQILIVLFMTDEGLSTKNIYITSENGVKMCMSTSKYLGTSLKYQIDKVVKIPSTKHISVPPETSDVLFVITQVTEYILKKN